MKRNVKAFGRLICYFLIPALGAYTCYASGSFFYAAVQSIILWVVSMLVLEFLLCYAEEASKEAEAALVENEALNKEREKTTEKVKSAYSWVQAILADGFLVRSADEAELSLMLNEPARRSASNSLIKFCKELNGSADDKDSYDTSSIMDQFMKAKVFEKKSALSRYR